MNRRTILVLLGILIGACACIACGTLLALGGWSALSSFDSELETRNSVPVLGTPTRRADTSATTTSRSLPTPSADFITPGPIPPSSLQTRAVDLGDAESLDRAEENLTNWMREESGVREILGSRSDETFRQFDAARRDAIEDIVTKAQNGGKPRGRPAPLPPRSTNPLPPYQGALIKYALGLLAYSPILFSDLRRDPETNPDLPPFDSRKPIQDGGEIELVLQPKFDGDWFIGTIKLSGRSQKNGVVYEETAAGTIKTPLCPNAKGELPVELEFKGGLRSSRGSNVAGMQLSLSIRATGQVNEDAQLTTVEYETRNEMAKQDPTGSNEYVEWTDNFKYVGLEKVSNGGVSVRDRRSQFTRASSHATEKLAWKSLDAMFDTNALIIYITLLGAQEKWQNGYCVEVAVPEMGESKAKSVMPNSETPFTGVVRHKFEGKELQLPVRATLTSGKVSVTPSGVQVTAPAKFTYKAPGQSGQDAVVDLETRSRRGIGKLQVTFRTGGYYVNQDLGGGNRMYGPICHPLDQPFTLYYTGGNILSGTYQFVPSSDKAGAWTFSGTLEGGGRHTGAGKYTIETTATGPVIRMAPGTFTITVPPVSTTIGGQAATLILQPDLNCQ